MIAVTVNTTDAEQEINMSNPTQNKAIHDILTASPEDVGLFADWVYNNYLCTVAEFIKMKAAESKESDCDI